MKNEKVPFLDLSIQMKQIRAEVDAAIAKVVDDNTYCLGSGVQEFEKAFAGYCKVKYAVGVNSGTSALHLAMILLGVGPGDEVITTPMTFASTSWAISYVGARPVYVDIDDETMNIDPSLVERAITSRTKAILPVHLHGSPCEMEGLLSISSKHGIHLVEDAAQAHGALCRGRPAGSIGEMGLFSFYPGKNLGACGEGGALVTNSEKYFNRAILLRNHASSDRYHHLEIGYNYRMEGIQGAVLAVKLKYLDKWNSRRREIAKIYDSSLGNTGLKLPVVKGNTESVYHHYVVRLPDSERFCRHLETNSIGFGLHYPVPLHLQPCYKRLGYRKGDFPVAEKTAHESVSLPLYPEMTKRQVDRVVEVVKSFLTE